MKLITRLGVRLFGTVIVACCAHGQTYSPLFAPSSSNNGTAYCRYANGSRVPNCYMRLFTGVYLNTNGHLHDDPSHPISSVSPASGISDNNGNLAITVTTTIVGQAETVLVNDYFAGLWNNTDYAVGYTLYWAGGHPEFWDLVGGTDTGKDTGHGTTSNNHWMTLNAANGIYNAAVTFQGRHPDQSRFCMNDMGLPFGGKFDLNKNWASPHAAHDLGTAADVGSAGASQCNGTNALPTANMADFKQACVDNLANRDRSIVHYDLLHVHCYWDY